MPPYPNSYKLLRLLIKNSKSGMFRGRHVTIFVNYFGLLHSFSGGLRGELKVEGVRPMELIEYWNAGYLNIGRLE